MAATHATSDKTQEVKNMAATHATSDKTQKVKNMAATQSKRARETKRRRGADTLPGAARDEKEHLALCCGDVERPGRRVRSRFPPARAGEGYML